MMQNGGRVDLILVNPGSNQIKNRTEHLGIACLKSYISLKNFTVDTIDLGLEGKTRSDIIQELIITNPEMIGLSLLYATAQKGMKIILDLRKNGYRR